MTPGSSWSWLVGSMRRARSSGFSWTPKLACLTVIAPAPQSSRPRRGPPFVFSEGWPPSARLRASVPSRTRRRILARVGLASRVEFIGVAVVTAENGALFPGRVPHVRQSVHGPKTNSSNAFPLCAKDPCSRPQPFLPHAKAFEGAAPHPFSAHGFRSCSSHGHADELHSSCSSLPLETCQRPPCSTTRPGV
jgi:hypothetical protein